jgi:hypothetical protein
MYANKRSTKSSSVGFFYHLCISDAFQMTCCVNSNFNLTGAS